MTPIIIDGNISFTDPCKKTMIAMFWDYKVWNCVLHAEQSWGRHLTSWWVCSYQHYTTGHHTGYGVAPWTRVRPHHTTMCSMCISGWQSLLYAIHTKHSLLLSPHLALHCSGEVLPRNEFWGSSLSQTALDFIHFHKKINLWIWFLEVSSLDKDHYQFSHRIKIQ